MTKTNTTTTAKTTDKTTAAKAPEAKTVETKAAETTAAPAANFIAETLEKVQESIVVPEAAREFMATQAAAVQNHAEKAHESAAELAADMEKSAVSLVGQYTTFTKNLFDMTAANVEHALATVEKIAAAKTPVEAMRVQADYVRESATANFERIKNAAETANKTVTETTASVRDQAAKIMAKASKAA
ncbi:TIGR01841 family phasin [Hoeflea sp. Naph1]|uniref:TIGR01841 family phasin n=1 Tax=Hoeflea sp. Naph1 TaxID=3388653 RepID=UPI00398F8F0F